MDTVRLTIDAALFDAAAACAVCCYADDLFAALSGLAAAIRVPGVPDTHRYENPDTALAYSQSGFVSHAQRIAQRNRGCTSPAVLPYRLDAGPDRDDRAVGARVVERDLACDDAGLKHRQKHCCPIGREDALAVPSSCSILTTLIGRGMRNSWVAKLQQCACPGFLPQGDITAMAAVFYRTVMLTNTFSPSRNPPALVARARAHM